MTSLSLIQDMGTRPFRKKEGNFRLIDDTSYMTFTRTGDQFGIDSGGDLVKSTTDNAAFVFGEGVLLEGARTNLFLNSFVPVTQTVTVTAVPHTLTVKGTGSITVSGVGAGTSSEGSPLTLTPTAGGLICTITGSLDNVNLEAASFGSSFIETFGATATRSATSLTRAWPFPKNGISGQIKVRPQFDDTDNKPSTEAGLLALYSSSTNFLQLIYHSTTGRITLNKRVSAGTQVFLDQSANTYNKGDLLNIRFKQDTSGIHLWINGLGKISNTSGDAPIDFSEVLNSIAGDAKAGNINQSFQTVESQRIWNEAKSDDFLESLT
jgi:hypothetical protein